MGKNVKLPNSLFSKKTNPFRNPLLVVFLSLIALGLALTVISCSPHSLHPRPQSTEPRLAPSAETSSPTKTEMQSLVKQKAKEFFERKITIADLEVPLLNDFLTTHETYAARGYSKDDPYPFRKVIAVSQDGHTFVLPDEFNQLIEREKVRVEDEDTAIKLAKGYILIAQDEGMAKIIIFPNQAAEIPWRKKPDYAKSPANYTNIIKPPQISLRNQTYFVELYTWHQIQGEIYHWSIKIKPSGLIDVEAVRKIASYIGDCRHSVFE